MSMTSMTMHNRIGIILCFVGMVFLWASSAGAVRLNDKAPEFTLQDLNGKSVSLSAYQGKVVYINFWASWCGPCEDEFPLLNQLAEKYRSKEFVVLAVSLDVKKADANVFLAKHSPLASKMEILWDPNLTMMDSYGFRSLPMSYIVDKKGVIRYIHFGFKETYPAQWPGEIEALLK